MEDKLSDLRAKLEAAKKERGKLSEIALATKLSGRTIYSVMHAQRKPNKTTIEALVVYFKREERKAAKQ